MKPTIDPQYVVDFLNEIHQLDPTVLQALVNYRVPCNRGLADHPTVQATNAGELGDGRIRVGLLGILNGLVGIQDHGQGYIASVYGNEGHLTGFRLTGDLASEFDRKISIDTDVMSKLEPHQTSSGFCSDIVIGSAIDIRPRNMMPTCCWTGSPSAFGVGCGSINIGGVWGLSGSSPSSGSPGPGCICGSVMFDGAFGLPSGHNLGVAICGSMNMGGQWLGWHSSGKVGI